MGSRHEGQSERGQGADRPVERVSWDDVQEFIHALNERERAERYRLPTEAKWEYACRAGTDGPFSTGRTITTDQANFDGTEPYGSSPAGLDRQDTVPVGRFAPNAFGLHDMHGNVREWCSDRYDAEYYKGSPVDDPPGQGFGAGRVYRGGGWVDFAESCRSATRGYARPYAEMDDLGFRLVMMIAP